MPREKICRRVCFAPENRRFLPEVEGGGSVTLTLDELEALRLMDREGGSQCDCAQRMGVSRGTFQRILHAARYKVADALIQGKAICLEGGDYELSRRPCGCGRMCKGCHYQASPEAEQSNCGSSGAGNKGE